MEIWVRVLQFMMSLSLLVIIHEFGHYLFARLFKTRVEKFYLFFNPWFSLFKFKRGETEYGMGWLPLGGYVKISGMIDESMDTTQMKQPMQTYEFRAKPAWQRLLIMTGGVLMNVLLAVMIYIGMSYKYGDSYIATEDAKYGFVFSELGQEIGFRNGDKIVNIGGEKIENYRQIFPALLFDKVSYVEVERAGAPVTIYLSEEYIPEMIKDQAFLELRIPFEAAAVPEKGAAAQAGVQAGDRFVAFNGEPMEFLDQYKKGLQDHTGELVQLTVERKSGDSLALLELPVQVSEAGTIGIALTPLPELFKIRTRDYSFLEAIPAGFQRAGEMISSYVKQLKLIFSPETEAYKSIGGFIAIGKIFPAEWNWFDFWNTTAFLSVILAVMNILPIPALDGGHVLFLLYEVVTRRKPSEKFMERAQMVGLFVLLALVVFANANDIYKLFVG